MSATTFNKKILHVILCMVLIPFNFAYPSCSSFLSSSIILPETFTRLSEGCSLTVQDEFTIELPLSLSSFPQITQFNLDISNDKDSFHAKLIPHFSNKAYTFEISHEGQQEQYELQSGDQALILTVKDGTYVLNVKDFPINISRSLKRGSMYTLTLHFSHEELLELKKHTSFRNLDQCPADYFLVEGTCMRVCPAKQFNNSGACTRCSDKCSSGRCISADKCNPCKSNEVFSQELNSCVEKCPENFFEDLNNKVCVKCSDGCKACNFPNGLCSASNFKTDMLINLAVSFILLTLITLCACYSNKDKTEPEKATADQKGEQKQEDKTPQIKTKGNSDHIKKIVGTDPEAPYLVLSEGINYDDEGRDAEDKDSELKKKRLTAYAESKLLYLSVQKGFMIDDADEERAISHGSGSKLNHRIASISTLSCKTESPLYKPKRRDSKNVQQSSFAPDRKSRLNTEDTPTLHANTYGELGSPYSGLSGLGTKKEPSLGLMAAARKKESTDATLFFELLDEQGAGKEGEYLKPPPEIPETENSRVTIKEEEVMEEIQEIDEEREGYKCDSSISMSKETERVSELYTCPICSMNKRDCLNKPCGHVAGCYSCMEQYKESYGVCPRCKKYLANIEKIDSEENKEMKAPQETKNNKKDKTIGGLLDRY